MTGLLTEIGRKLAERWLAVLVLPGLLLTAVLAMGLLLRQAEALSVPALVAEASATSRRIQAGGGVAIGVALVAALLLAGAFGLAAQGLGRLIRAGWLGDWPVWTRPVRDRLVRRRARRWADNQARVEETVAGGGDPSRFARRRNAISLAPPSRPTWMGDRIAGADVRVFAEYSLDLTACWPRLWLVLPEETRGELRSASTALDAATVLAGWAVLYLLASALWWPSAVVGVIVYATAWYRGRRTSAALADLLESAADLHGGALCVALGLGPAATLTPELGAAITARCRKGA